MDGFSSKPRISETWTAQLSDSQCGTFPVDSILANIDQDRDNRVLREQEGVSESPDKKAILKRDNENPKELGTKRDPRGPCETQTRDCRERHQDLACWQVRQRASPPPTSSRLVFPQCPDKPCRRHEAAAVAAKIGILGKNRCHSSHHLCPCWHGKLKTERGHGRRLGRGWVDTLLSPVLKIYHVRGKIGTFTSRGS